MFLIKEQILVALGTLTLFVISVPTYLLRIRTERLTSYYVYLRAHVCFKLRVK